MEMVYRARPGFRVNTSAEVVGRRIDELSESLGGRITPRDVVEDARPPDAVLHDEFVWNIDAAAHLHWEHRARELMRSVVKVFIRDDGTESPPLIGQVSIRDDDGRAYRPIGEVVRNPDWAAQMLADAQRQIDGLTHRLRLLTEAAAVVADLDRARARLAALAARRAKAAARREKTARVGGGKGGTKRRRAAVAGAR